MLVRYLSGLSVGGVQEVPQVEGEVLVATGYAERVSEDAPSVVVPIAEPSVEPVTTEPAAEPVVTDEPSE